MAYLFPALPSAVLVQVAQGEADVTIEGDKVIIKYTDTWTPSGGGYAWVITKDCVGCLPGDWNDPEPSDWNSTLTGLSPEEIRSSESGERFSMYDDDGNCCYEGIFIGDDDATRFEPLEDFGRPNMCSEIRYRNPNTGKMERL